MHLQSLKLARPLVKKAIHIQKFKVKITQIVNQHPLHHVTYSPEKFEVATFNGLGRDAFTRNFTHTSTHPYVRMHG